MCLFLEQLQIHGAAGKEADWRVFLLSVRLWRKKKKMLGSSIPCAGSCECQGRGWKRKPCAPIGTRGSISDRDLGMGKENATFPYSPWLCSIFSRSCCIFAIFSFTGMCGNIKALLNDGPVLHTMPQGLCTQQMRSLMQRRWVLGYGCAESQGAGLLQGWPPNPLRVLLACPFSKTHRLYLLWGRPVLPPAHA